MDTVVIGAAFMDIKGFAFNAFNPVGTNIGRVNFVPGGVSRNVCEDFARQGDPVSFISMVDRTDMGQAIKAQLETLGVNVEHILLTDDGMGIWLALLDERGDLVGSISKQPNFGPLQDYVRLYGSEIIQRADAVVLEMDTEETIAEMVIALAKEHQTPVYVVVGNMSIICRRPDLLRDIRCYICNEIELSKLLGQSCEQSDVAMMTQQMNACMERYSIPAMVVTMGDRGAVFKDTLTGESGFQPAIPTTMVDSTGAGDAFLAGTVMGMNRGYPLRKAVLIGARLASATLNSSQSSCDLVEGLFDLPQNWP